MNYSNHELKEVINNDVSKKFNVIKKGILSLMVLVLTFTSCSNNDEVAETEDVTQSTLEVQRSAEIDQIDSVLGDIVIDAYEAQESTAERNGVATNSSDDTFYAKDIPDCVTITVVAQQNYREVTLDFGTEGCVVNGHLIQGQIVFDYTRNPEAQQIMVNYNLIDFYFDAKNIIASRSILKELSNDNGNPQFTHDLSITVIWPNGVQASREGTRIREWVEGFGSGVFSDNVFEITGDWTATFVNGNTHTYEVITPLRREVICAYFVSGSFDVQRTNFGGVFDFGEGECDNQATFTFNNGTEVPITLN
ncbi:MAG: hypothetical protein CMC05_14910 [Flavobacteriaceae bacterium]|uniref:hypothetical protein n=1 Tax=Winogradskyella poriferorum TaxID=307627 RepID=UPI000C6BFCEC|nr:hypothetical protein [Flavobacteriaceae bacterium]MBD10807.1 hypothetical protein [Flavobacteriaceae bacterium]|tara:strand:+ start:2650 stop:3570 length:921 start_codon:yes stop_codon:yes gene_type:complete